MIPMWNPFRQPLAMSMRSGGSSTLTDETVSLGGMEDAGWDYPSTVELGDTINPVEPGIGNGPTMWRGNATERPEFQQYAPGYAGVDQWHVGEDNPVQGLSESFANAYSRHDLNGTEDVGGIPGTNRQFYVAQGPVTGNGTDWSGVRSQLYQETPGYYGPVGGGQDYSEQVTRAYFQAQAAQFSQAAAESAMIASI